MDEKDQKERFDKVLHITKELKLSVGEQVVLVQKLFPKFNNIDIYDSTLGNYELERYMYARSLGLDVGDAAHYAEISSKLMHEALEGIGVSLERFAVLAHIELTSSYSLIVTLLSNIERASSSVDVSASLSLLEKIAPAKYGKNVAVASVSENKKQVVINFSTRNDEEDVEAESGANV